MNECRLTKLTKCVVHVTPKSPPVPIGVSELKVVVCDDKGLEHNLITVGMGPIAVTNERLSVQAALPEGGLLLERIASFFFSIQISAGNARRERCTSWIEMDPETQKFDFVTVTECVKIEATLEVCSQQEIARFLRCRVIERLAAVPDVRSKVQAFLNSANDDTSSMIQKLEDTCTHLASDADGAALAATTAIKRLLGTLTKSEEASIALAVASNVAAGVGALAKVEPLLSTIGGVVADVAGFVKLLVEALPFGAALVAVVSKLCRAIVAFKEAKDVLEGLLQKVAIFLTTLRNPAVLQYVARFEDGSQMYCIVTKTLSDCRQVAEALARTNGNVLVRFFTATRTTAALKAALAEATSDFGQLVDIVTMHAAAVQSGKLDAVQDTSKKVLDEITALHAKLDAALGSRSDSSLDRKNLMTSLVLAYRELKKALTGSNAELCKHFAVASKEWRELQAENRDQLEEIRHLLVMLLDREKPSAVKQELVVRDDILDKLHEWNCATYRFMPCFVSNDILPVTEMEFTERFVPLTARTVTKEGTASRYFESVAEAWNSVVGGDGSSSPSNKNNAVLIEAPAGSGKSTVVKWLARNRNALKMARGKPCSGVLLFELLRLEQYFREQPTLNASDITLELLLRMQLASDMQCWFTPEELPAVTKRLLERKGELLFVFDGYDEVQYTDCRAMRCFLASLHTAMARPDGFARLAGNVLVMTRPEHSGSFECGSAILPTFEAYPVLRLMLWSEAACDKYVDEFPRLTSDAKAQVKEVLLTERFDALERLPFTVHLVCCVLLLRSSDPQAQSSASSMPPSHLFGEVVDLTLNKKTVENNADGSTKALPVAPSTLRRQVQQKAFAAALANKTEVTLGEEQVAVRHCGLVEKIHKQQHRFLHKTLMEYLAACHVVDELTKPNQSNMQPLEQLPLTQNVALFFVADILHADHASSAARQQAMEHIARRFKAECEQLDAKLKKHKLDAQSLCLEQREGFAQQHAFSSVLQFFATVAVRSLINERHKDDYDGTRTDVKLLLDSLPGSNAARLLGTALPGALARNVAPSWSFLMIEPAARLGALYVLQRLCANCGFKPLMHRAALEATASKRGQATLDYLLEHHKTSVTLKDAVEGQHIAAVEKMLAAVQNVDDVEWCDRVTTCVQLRRFDISEKLMNKLRELTIETLGGPTGWQSFVTEVNRIVPLILQRGNLLELSKLLPHEALFAASLTNTELNIDSRRDLGTGSHRLLLHEINGQPRAIWCSREGATRLTLNIDDAGDPLIVAIILNLPQLRALDVRCTGGKITDKSITEIALHCPELQSLDVSGTDGKITDASIKEIAVHCPQLQSLNVSWTHGKITDASIKEIVLHCPQLQSLNVWGTEGKITDASIKEIASRCQQLQSLNVSETGGAITDASIKEIAQHCPQLQSLNVSWTSGKITDASIKEIATHCPRCQTVKW